MKKLLPFLVLATLILSACSAQGASSGVATFTPVGGAQPEVSSTEEVSLPTEETAASEPTSSEPTVFPTTAFVASEPAKCTVISEPVIAEPDPTEMYLFPPVTEEDWVDGDPDTKVTFMVYSDFQCPYCGQLDPILAQLVEDYPDEVNVVFRHYPLAMHDKALAAAQAAEAAGLQGKFNEMRAALFNSQPVWSAMTMEAFQEWAAAQAKTLKLDVAQFTEDMLSDEIVKKVQTAQDDGVAKQIPGTPFMLINGRIYQGPRDSQSLAAIVKLVNMESNQYDNCPELTIDPTKTYTAVLETTKGDVTVELYPQQAPVAVNNFIFLARSGWYDNMIFHRVLPGFVAQSGDPSGSGYGSPGYAFSNEVTPELRFDKPGVLGMANAGPDSNGSQFFIAYAALPQLDGQYTIFGQVIDGMDVAEKLTPRDPTSGTELPEGDHILSITVEEK